MQDIQAIQTQLGEELAAATSERELEAVRVRYLGRKGVVTLLRKNADFSRMTADEKKRFGQQFNQLKVVEIGLDVIAGLNPKPHRPGDLFQFHLDQ